MRGTRLHYDDKKTSSGKERTQTPKYPVPRTHWLQAHARRVETETSELFTTHWGRVKSIRFTQDLGGGVVEFSPQRSRESGEQPV